VFWLFIKYRGLSLTLLVLSQGKSVDAQDLFLKYTQPTIIELNEQQPFLAKFTSFVSNELFIQSLILLFIILGIGWTMYKFYLKTEDSRRQARICIEIGSAKQCLLLPWMELMHSAESYSLILTKNGLIDLSITPFTFKVLLTLSNIRILLEDTQINFISEIPVARLISRYALFQLRSIVAEQYYIAIVIQDENGGIAVNHILKTMQQPLPRLNRSTSSMIIPPGISQRSLLPVHLETMPETTEI
jgi:hypothetical protein